MGLIFLLIWLIIVFAQRPRASALRNGWHWSRRARRIPEFAPAGRTSAGARATSVPVLVRPILSRVRSPNMPGCSFSAASPHGARRRDASFGFDDASLNAAAWRELQTLARAAS